MTPKADIAVLSAHSPNLGRIVTLSENIWKYKILEAHPEMKQRLHLVEETIKDSSLPLYRKVSNPKKLAIFKETHYFEPLNHFLKVALDINNEEAVVTTAHACWNIPTGMEKIK